MPETKYFDWLFTYDNVAIAVLALCLFSSIVANILQFKANRELVKFIISNISELTKDMALILTVLKIEKNGGK